MDEIFQGAAEVEADLSDEEREAMDYYLTGGGREKRPMVNYTGPERRFYTGEERRSPYRVVDNMVYQYIGMKRHSNGNADSERAFETFKDWTPLSVDEARLANETTYQKLAALLRGKEDKGEIKDRYHAAVGYLETVLEDQQKLDTVLVEKDGELDVDPDRLRISDAALGVIAKHLMSRDFVWNNYWPTPGSNAYKDRQKYWLGFSIAASRMATDDALSELFKFVYERNNNRMEFWLKQKIDTENLQITQDMIKEGEIIPVELELKLQASASEHPNVTNLKPSTFKASISPNIRQMIDEQRRREEEIVRLKNEEFDRAFEEELEKLMSVSRFNSADERRKEALRRLKQRGIEPASLSSEIHDQEDARELQEIAERAAKQRVPKKKPRTTSKPKPGIGHRADMANNDPRVRFEVHGEDV